MKVYNEGSNESIDMPFSAFESTDNVEPTSRLLEGSSDSWAVEEWAEPCECGKIKATMYYLFSSDEIAEAVERNPDNPAEEYPWDAEHCSRCVISDDSRFDDDDPNFIMRTRAIF